jgi:hypothetical protein
MREFAYRIFDSIVGGGMAVDGQLLANCFD